ncbi:MAG: hypothetical protein Q7R47_04185 [Candidatus Diapherotrites archaeon]|nr:hypothetical protein [Candidatus Diapherotrites archaeon]
MQRASWSVRNNKGIIEVVSAFFLVVTIVLIVISLFYLNALVLGQESQVYSGLQTYAVANDVQKNLLSCFGERTRANLQDATKGMECLGSLKVAQKPRVKGVSFEQLAFLGCPAWSATVGEVSACSPGAERFVFWISVDNSGRSCATRMSMCLYKDQGAFG